MDLLQNAEEDSLLSTIIKMLKQYTGFSLWENLFKLCFIIAKKFTFFNECMKYFHERTCKGLTLLITFQLILLLYSLHKLPEKGKDTMKLLCQDLYERNQRSIREFMRYTLNDVKYKKVEFLSNIYSDLNAIMDNSTAEVSTLYFATIFKTNALLSIKEATMDIIEEMSTDSLITTAFKTITNTKPVITPQVELAMKEIPDININEITNMTLGVMNYSLGDLDDSTNGLEYYLTPLRVYNQISLFEQLKAVPGKTLDNLRMTIEYSDSKTLKSLVNDRRWNDFKDDIEHNFKFFEKRLSSEASTMQYEFISSIQESQIGVIRGHDPLITLGEIPSLNKYKDDLKLGLTLESTIIGFIFMFYFFVLAIGRYRRYKKEQRYIQ